MASEGSAPEKCPHVPPAVNGLDRTRPDARQEKSPHFCGPLNSGELRRTARWWRRRESNPRPKVLYSSALRA